NSKLQAPKKHPAPSSKITRAPLPTSVFGVWWFEIWNFFGAWGLVLGVWIRAGSKLRCAPDGITLRIFVEWKRAFAKLRMRTKQPTTLSMKRRLLAAGLVTFCISSQAEIKDPVTLWPEGAPGALGKEDADVPTITPYSPEPDKATGSALVV